MEQVWGRFGAEPTTRRNPDINFAIIRIEKEKKKVVLPFLMKGESNNIKNELDEILLISKESIDYANRS